MDRVDGLRQAKETGGITTTHLWDGSNLVADYDGGAVIASYVRGANLLRSNTSTGSAYYLYNGHGDVTGLTDGFGALTWEYDYDAFGNEREIAGQDPAIDANPFRYAGEYLDLETNTYYLRARNYNPATGRFLTEDPAMDGLNWYTYAGNNPIMFVDPWGLALVIARDYAESIGASVDWTGNSTKNGIAYSNATVTYNGQSINISGALTNGRLMIDDSVLNNYFGWNNPWISTGETQAVHLGTHLVGGTYGTSSHASVIIFAGHDSELLTMYPAQFKNSHMGMMYTTIGAGQSNPEGNPNWLFAEFNRGNDKDMWIKNSMVFTGVNDIFSINNLFDRANYYMDNSNSVIPYSTFPVRPTQYNSNSFANGLLRSAGITIDHPGKQIYWNRWSVNTPGWGNPVPLYRFGV